MKTSARDFTRNIAQSLGVALTEDQIAALAKQAQVPAAKPRKAPLPTPAAHAVNIVIPVTDKFGASAGTLVLSRFQPAKTSVGSGRYFGVLGNERHPVELSGSQFAKLQAGSNVGAWFPTTRQVGVIRKA